LFRPKGATGKGARASRLPSCAAAWKKYADVNLTKSRSAICSKTGGKIHSSQQRRKNIMQAMTKMNDPQKARSFFENKIAFTTGPMELSQMLKSGDVTVVDVRAAEDFEKGHVPGAINLPKENWDNPRGLSKDHNNVVYCYTQQCHLAAHACVAFASKGFPVVEMEGGFETWKEDELEIEYENKMRAAA
jgi:rhodanese-related sulfurtransferase